MKKEHTNKHVRTSRIYPEISKLHKHRVLISIVIYIFYRPTVAALPRGSCYSNWYTHLVSCFWPVWCTFPSPWSWPAAPSPQRSSSCPAPCLQWPGSRRHSGGCGLSGDPIGWNNCCHAHPGCEGPSLVGPTGGELDEHRSCLCRMDIMGMGHAIIIIGMGNGDRTYPLGMNALKIISEEPPT